MFTLNMVKFNAMAAAMGRDPWEVHTLTGMMSIELAKITARDLVRSARCYVAAEIGKEGERLAVLGQVFSDGALEWATA